MMRRAILAGLCAVGLYIAPPAGADQLPEPLVFQLQRLAALYGNWEEIEEVDGRMLQRVTRAPNDEIVLAVFGVQRYGANHRTGQFFAVFVPENRTPHPQHFRLIDVIRIGGPGTRSIDRLDAKVTHDRKSGETSFIIPALAHRQGDAPNAPGGKTVIQLKLVNGRLVEMRGP